MNKANGNDDIRNVVSGWVSSSRFMAPCLKCIVDSRMWPFRMLIGVSLLVFVYHAIDGFPAIVSLVKQMLVRNIFVGSLSFLLALVFSFYLFRCRKKILCWASKVAGSVIEKVLLFTVSLLGLAYALLQKTIYHELAGHILCVCLTLLLGFCIFHSKNQIIRWFSLIEGSVIQKVVASVLLLLCLGFTLTQKTIYPITHVGMFEESTYTRLTKDTQITAPSMYCHYVDGEFRVESIRRASYFFPGDLDLDCHIYLGMIYFKWRHTEYVNDIIIKAGQSRGLKLSPMDLIYSLGEEVHFISKTKSKLSTEKARFNCGREYCKSQ